MRKPTSKLMPWLNWGIVTIFVLFQFFLQISASVMTEDWMREFNLTQLGVSSLSSMFFYAYVSLQIPVGLFYQRYKVKTILSSASFLLAIGCLLLSYTTNYYMACLARILMGTGSAFGFVGMLHTSNIWFSKHKFALIVGLAEMLAMLFVATLSNRLGWLVSLFGWRLMLFYSGIIAFILIFLVLFIVRESPRSIREKRKREKKAQNTLSLLREAVFQPNVWLAGFLGFSLFGLVNAFASLWGTPFFIHTMDLDIEKAASLVSMLLFGIALGCPMVGWLCKHLPHKPILYVCMSLCLLCLTSVIVIPNLSMGLSYFLLFTTGFFSSCYLLTFVIVKESVPNYLQTASLGITNSIIMAGAPVLQSLIAVLLESNIFDITADNIVLTYRISLLTLPLVILISMYIVYVIRLPKTNHDHVGRKRMSS